jgi:hypothetical protein
METSIFLGPVIGAAIGYITNGFANTYDRDNVNDSFYFLFVNQLEKGARY